MEDLNVKGMMKNHKLAKSLQELSLNKFKTMLTYKASWRGNIVLQIGRYFASSKQCSCCKVKNKSLTLKDRTWKCNNCGVVHDRDINASININNEGINKILKDETLLSSVQSYLSYSLEKEIDEKFTINFLKELELNVPYPPVEGM